MWLVSNACMAPTVKNANNLSGFSAFAKFLLYCYSKNCLLDNYDARSHCVSGFKDKRSKATVQPPYLFCALFTFDEFDFD